VNQRVDEFTERAEREGLVVADDASRGCRLSEEPTKDGFRN
jgi:hypothetical protein